MIRRGRNKRPAKKPTNNIIIRNKNKNNIEIHFHKPARKPAVAKNAQPANKPGPFYGNFPFPMMGGGGGQPIVINNIPAQHQPVIQPVQQPINIHIPANADVAKQIDDERKGLQEGFERLSKGLNENIDLVHRDLSSKQDKHAKEVQKGYMDNLANLANRDGQQMKFNQEIRQRVQKDQEQVNKRISDELERYDQVHTGKIDEVKNYVDQNHTSKIDVLNEELKRKFENLHKQHNENLSTISEIDKQNTGNLNLFRETVNTNFSHGYKRQEALQDELTGYAKDHSNRIDNLKGQLEIHGERINTLDTKRQSDIQKINENTISENARHSELVQTFNISEQERLRHNREIEDLINRRHIERGEQDDNYNSALTDIYNKTTDLEKNLQNDRNLHTKHRQSVLEQIIKINDKVGSFIPDDSKSRELENLKARRNFNSAPSALTTPPPVGLTRAHAIRHKSPMTPNTVVSSELDRVQDILDKKIKMDTPAPRGRPKNKKLIELVKESDAFTGGTALQQPRIIKPPEKYSPSPSPSELRFAELFAKERAQNP
jgi:hypothetical protein